MNATELSHRLAGNALAVCRYLLPQGKVEGDEYRCGSVNGEPGKSLGVHLKGTKAGVWADFASGEGGDLIDLWKACRGLDTIDALDEVRAWLGIEQPNFVGKQKKKFDPPRKPEGIQKADDSYLGSRGIGKEVIERLRIAQRGDTLYFPFIPAGGGDPAMIKFRETRDKKCGPTSKNQMPILFGWQAACPNARSAWIVEGEIDAASGYQMGIPVCLSVPFGGGKEKKQEQWLVNEFDNLERFDTIYIATDMDEEGEVAAEYITARLGAARCQRVILPKKDLNECLQAGLTDWRKFEVRNYDPEELRRPSDFMDEVMHDLFPGELQGIRLPWREKFGERLLFRDGELIIVNGINGHGKSQFLGHLLVDIASKGRDICIYSGELRPGRLLSRMVRQVNGEPNIPSRQNAETCLYWLDESMLIFDLTGTAKADRLLEVFEYAYRKYGVTVFAIDSLMKCGIGVDDYNGQKKFVERLCDFKNKFGVTIFLVTHSRKVADEAAFSGKMDVKGDSSITDLPDTVLSVWRNKPKEQHLEECEVTGAMPDPDILEEGDAVIHCVKQRNGDWEGSVGLHFSRQSLQYIEKASDELFEYLPAGSKV